MSRSEIRIGGAKVVFNAVTKKQFITKDFFVGGEDRLAGHKVASPARSWGARGEGSFGGSHSGLIGSGSRLL